MSFRLRRLGQTADDAVALFNLSSTITRIGRHSESSLCLISTEHPCLTSRSHAEIHCISDDVNDAKFLLRDTSLNGTYVNDRRVFDYHLLDEGDVITFGHYGGHLVKKGEMAPKQSAEFQYLFEKVNNCVSMPATESIASPLKVVSQHSTDANDDDLKQVVTQSIHRVTLFSQSDSECSARSDIDLASEQTICLCTDENVLTGRQSDVSFNRQAKTSNSVSSLHMQKTTNCKNGRDFSVAAIMGGPVGNVNRSASVNSPCAPTGGSSSSKQSRAPSDAATCLPVPQMNYTRAVRLVSYEPGSRDADKRLSADDAMATTRSPLFDVSQQLTQANRRHSLPKAGRVVARSVDDKSDKLTDRKRRAPPTKSKVKRQSKTNAKKAQYHNATDKCAAIDCLKPKSITVLWVQCDDCDAWYHATCAGCTSSPDQLALAQFHCGCV